MKFQKGDKVVIKSDTKSGLSGNPEDFFGYVGIITLLPREITVWKNTYGVNFGRKIFRKIYDGSKFRITHHLGGRLKRSYGQFVHEDDLEFFNIENTFPESQEEDESGIEDLI